MAEDSGASGDQQSQATGSSGGNPEDNNKKVEVINAESLSKSVVKPASGDTQYQLDVNPDDVKLEVRGPDFVLVFPGGIEVTLLLAGVMIATEKAIEFKFADGTVISGDDFIAKAEFAESEDVPVNMLKGAEGESEESVDESTEQKQQSSYSESDAKKQSKSTKEIKKNEEEFKAKEKVEEVEQHEGDFTESLTSTKSNVSNIAPDDNVAPYESLSEGNVDITFSVSVTNVGAKTAGQLIVGGGGNDPSITQADPEQHLGAEYFGGSGDGLNGENPDNTFNTNNGLEIYGDNPSLFSNTLNSKELILQNDANITDIAEIYVENVPDGWGVASGADQGDGSWL
nr:hypothetical protein [Endozoicomonas sp.]